jgi:acetyl esterase/lipase
MLPSSSPFADDSEEPRSPKPLPPGVRTIADCEYSPDGHPRHRLDLYLPEDISQPLPTILWIHGGGWVTGDKAGGPAIQFATKGFAVASMNYRYSRHATFPAQTYDCKAAVRWLRANSKTYSLDIANIGVWGASAGGHLASMLGLTTGNELLEGTLGNADQSSAVKAVVDWFGPTDFMTLGSRDTRTQFLGGDALDHPEKANAASPIRYVTDQACPFFIVHGDQDPLVPYSQSEAFAKALEHAGVDVTFVTISGGRHGGSKFSRPDEIARIEAFFNKHLKSR